MALARSQSPEEPIEGEDLLHSGNRRSDSTQPLFGRGGIFDTQTNKRLEIFVEAWKDITLEILDLKNRLNR